MKSKKRFIKAAAVLMSVILLVSSFGVSALAADNTPVGYIVKVPDGVSSDNVLTDAEYLRYADIIENYGDALEAIYNGISNLESSIDVSGFNIPVSYAKAVTELVYRSFPEISYIDSLGYSYYPNKIAAFVPGYIEGDLKALKDRFIETAKSRYLSLIDDDMDDFTKAVILHDALVLNTYYPKDYITNPGSNYTYMLEGYGVCQYYSECYAYLLAQVGIKSEIVSSSDMGHAWLKIKLDGEWYNVDSTWDDPMNDKVGKAYHSNFLYSDAAFNTQDTDIKRKPHYGYKSINGADSKKYDNFNNLHSIRTQLCYVGGKFYAITSDGKLVRYDHKTDAVTVLKNIDYRWSAGSNGYWVGNFSSLVDHNGKLYYNSPSAVYEFDIATGTEKLFAQGTGSKSLYGIRITDGKLWGVYASDPNEGYVTPSFMKDMPAAEYSIRIGDGIIHGSVTADKEKAVPNEIVKLTVTPKDGFVINSVTVNDTVIEPEGGVYSFAMPAKDVTVSAVFGFEDEVGARLAGYTISLEGDIALNFYMELDDELINSGAYMRFTVPSGSDPYIMDVPVSEAEKTVMNGETYYVFKCSVAAKEMSSDIKAQMINGDIEGKEYTYSVKDYAEYMLAHPEEEEYLEAAELVKAMLNYGAYSQIYFRYNTDDLANSALSEDDRVLGEITAEEIGKSSFESDLPEGVEFIGSSLYLRSTTTLKLYFRSEDELSLSCDSGSTETVSDGDIQMICISGIAAKKLGDDFTVTVNNGKNSGSVSYSPMNYCYEVLKVESHEREFKDIVKALYRYRQAAENYTGYKIG